MKIKRPSDEKIIKNIKYYKILFIVGLFFFALSMAAAFMSTPIVMLIIFIGIIPLVFCLLFFNQELNYNKFLLEIRDIERKNKEEK